MVVDGKYIAANICTKLQGEVENLAITPVLTIITCNPNFETQKYLALKQRKAAEIGIRTEVIDLPLHSVTEDVVRVIQASITHAHGVIVQLPLPQAIDTQKVLSSIPHTHDVDGLNPENTEIISPVVGAIAEILQTHAVSFYGKQVTVIGKGRLVGIPAREWFEAQGAVVSVVTRDTDDIAHYTQHADIIVCGAGVPKILKPHMIQEGVVILDAGTSEDGGVLSGDADPTCAEKAILFTPVPGGIGPITIAILLRNVIKSAIRMSTQL